MNIFVRVTVPTHLRAHYGSAVEKYCQDSAPREQYNTFKGNLGFCGMIRTGDVMGVGLAFACWGCEGGILHPSLEQGGL